LCDATECAAGKYCETSSGLCRTPDESSDVCLTCATDQTGGLSWTSSNHQDAGKGYGAVLFDGDGACSNTIGPPCFNAAGIQISHKTSLASGSCCGDDANEYYKSDWYGAECTSSVDDCVWGDGNATSSDTGNADWWCYLHEWSQCTDGAIGTKVGGVTCAGIDGNKAWTIHANVLSENHYSCTDGKDNDGDGLADCDDSDCDGSVSGTIHNAEDEGVYAAQVQVRQGVSILASALTGEDGQYSIPVRCSGSGSFNVVVKHEDYATITRSGIGVDPNENVVVDFTGENAIAKADSCESDCTFPASSIIQSSCAGKNGCMFYNNNDAQALIACENAQPGWERDYGSDNLLVCPAGPIRGKSDNKAIVTCAGGNIGRSTATVIYNGRTVKMTVVSCT
jgi:hypothetical protein